MKIRKFVAADMKDALAQVKRDLGGDAMIVASRPVRRGLLGNGIEVTAAVDLDERPSETTTTANTHTPAAPAGLSEADLERIMAPLRSELRGLRAQLRSVELRGDDELCNELREVRRALTLIKNDTPTDDTQPSLTALSTQHQLAAPSEGRVVALVGPTGVGKTTTIAKLAARAALVERRQVAIVTLDGFRVGGEEQMRTFADLIGVPLVAAEPERLSVVLAQLARHDRIFVDTAGRSPRDTAAMRDLGRAFANLNIETHLTLPASSSRATIDAWASRLSGLPIARLLFTKLDEAEGPLDEIVRAPARLSRPVSWLSNGQRVPEDLEEASTSRLLDLALMGLNPVEQAA